MAAVIDASFLLKSALPEKDEPRAAAVRNTLPHLHERFGLAAPTILAYEIGNVVHRGAKSLASMDWEGRAEIVAALLEDVELVAPDPSALRRTGRLAHAHALTFYDSSYLELVERDSGSIILTEDQRLLGAAQAIVGRGRALNATEAEAAIGDGRF